MKGEVYQAIALGFFLLLAGLAMRPPLGFPRRQPAIPKLRAAVPLPCLPPAALLGPVTFSHVLERDFTREALDERNTLIRILANLVTPR
jgi:hypothetical protein